MKEVKYQKKSGGINQKPPTDSYINTKLTRSFNTITEMAREIAEVNVALFHSCTSQKIKLDSYSGLAQTEIGINFSGCINLVISLKKSLFVADLRKDNRFKHFPLNIGGNEAKSFAGIPVYNTSQKVVAVLSVIGDTDKNLSAVQQSLLEKLAVQAAQIIQLKDKQHSLILRNKAANDANLLLEQLHETSGIATWVYAISSNTFSHNKKAYEVYEVPADYIFTAENSIAFYHPEDQLKVAKATKNISEKGIPFDFIARLITKNGTQKWVRSTGKKIGDKVIGTLQDISTLKKQELKYQGVFNSASSFVGILDLEGKIIEVNKISMQETGIEASNVEGQYFWSMSIWDSNAAIRDQVQQSIYKAAKGETSTFETKIINTSGQVIYVMFNARPIFDVNQKVIYIIAEGHPIDNLVRARDRYKAITEAASPGAWEWNVQRGELLFDTLWADMLGYTVAELSPISVKTWEDLTHPDDLKIAQEQLNLCFNKAIDFYEVEFRMLHKKGYWVWVRSYGRVMEWTNDDKPLRMYGAHLDITKRKKEAQRIENLLQISEAQNKRLKSFAHIVSHNLRSHGASMSGLLDLIINNSSDIPDYDLLNMLAKNSENLNQTIEDLTRVVKVNVEDQLSSTIVLHEIITRNIESLYTQIQSTNIEIINTVSEKITVKGVQAYVDSVFHNLISNAIKYKSEAKDSYLKISAKSEANYVVISFEDNGQGIDLKKYGSKLFGMYKTFHQHEDARGVGLFITKSQVESMGGHINVSSSVGIGSTFSVYLPI